LWLLVCWFILRSVAVKRQVLPQTHFSSALPKLI
jgi:hypothetical protein